MRILMVHGRSQGGKDKIKLRAEWLEALNQGLSSAGFTLPPSVKFDFPFYGDQLDDFVRRSQLPADPAIIPKGSPDFDEYAAFRVELAEDMRVRAGITDAEVRSEMRPVQNEKGVQNWEWVQALVRLLDRHMTGISQTTIEVFMRDVFLYTRRDDVRSAIDAVVAETLAADTDVVVGHSLGSVVSYSVLCAAKKKVPLFVTVGSPLAIRAVRATFRPISNPSGAMGWYNAYDPRDIVALYPLDASNFDVEPAIVNNANIRNRTDNRHGIVGYLDDSEVAKTIFSGLR